MLAKEVKQGMIFINYDPSYRESHWFFISKIEPSTPGRIEVTFLVHDKVNKKQTFFTTGYYAEEKFGLVLLSDVT